MGEVAGIGSARFGIFASDPNEWSRMDRPKGINSLFFFFKGVII